MPGGRGISHGHFVAPELPLPGGKGRVRRNDNVGRCVGRTADVHRVVVLGGVLVQGVGRVVFREASVHGVGSQILKSVGL